MSLPHVLCCHFAYCSGCQINVSVDQLPLFPEVQRFFQQRGVEPPSLVTGPARGWRCRAKLAVRQQAGEVDIGLYRAGSHEVVDIPLCRVHHPAINKAVEVLRGWIRSEDIKPYDEASGQGELRYLQFAVRRDTERVQLTLVVNSDLDSNGVGWEARVGALFNSTPELWHSVWLNGNTRRDNVILGTQWRLMAGDEWLWDTVGRAQVAFLPATFAQANPDLFGTLLDDLMTIVPQGTKVAEFYAGVGVIGLNLLTHGCAVQLNERTAGAEECFKQSLTRLAPEAAKRATFHTGPVERWTHLVDEAEWVVVDPPRKGLDRSLLTTLKKAQPGTRLVYISCGWPAFQRDAVDLLEAGWLLQGAKAYLLFPGTDQLEVMAWFEKKSG